MANEVQHFISSWKQLSLDDKNQLLSTLKQSSLNEAVGLKSASKFSHDEAAGLTSLEDQVYDGVKLSSYYNYLYYYPTIYWSLDRAPDTDNYWVGMFREGASDSDYVAFQWVREAQGSYYVGEIKSTYGNLDAGYHLDQYQLRIFKGDTRLPAKTNEIRGTIVIAPTDALTSTDVPVEFKQLETDGPKDSFMQAIESVNEAKVIGSQISKEDFQKQWDSFTPMQKQLLHPVLKHSSFPDEKKNPAPKLITDRPEPKVLFPDLGKAPQLEHAVALADTPTEIVLNLALQQDSYTYVYPKVTVTQTAGSKNAYMGMYYTQSTLNFQPDGYIDEDWQYVGEGQAGTTKLNYIEEKQYGQIDKQYLGVVFDDVGEGYVQLGYAATRIEAVISVADEVPPADYKVDFNKEEALTFAQLSLLAYENYSEVQQQLPTYGFTAEMEINKSSITANPVGFIGSNDTSVVVGFRGTVVTSYKDILTDAWFAKIPIFPGSPVLAHSGFVSAMELVYADIVDFLKKFPSGKKLYLTGHSLGGALASVLGYRLVHDGVYSASPIQYVYGCPPVGEPAFAESFNKDLSSTITITGDFVSSGILIRISKLQDLFKPNEVKYLPKSGGHTIYQYIDQLKELLS